MAASVSRASAHQAQGGVVRHESIVVFVAQRRRDADLIILALVTQRTTSSFGTSTQNSAVSGLPSWPLWASPHARLTRHTWGALRAR